MRFQVELWKDELRMRSGIKNNKIRRDFNMNEKSIHTTNKITAKKVQLKTKITCHHEENQTTPLRSSL